MKSTNIVPGTRFGRLVVLNESKGRLECGRNRRYVSALCDCGKKLEVKWGSLPNGNTQSCGCYGHERRLLSRLKSDRNLLALDSLYRERKSGALKRGHNWNLTFEQFKVLVLSPCYYSGRLPSQIWKASGGASCVVNGIDRKDNSKGYEIDNCVPCCKQINYAKRCLSEQEFRMLIKEVYDHSISECRTTALPRSASREVERKD